MKRIGILALAAVVVLAMMAPGFALGKGKPEGTPGKGPVRLGIAGSPFSSDSVLTKELTGPGKGWKKAKFVVQGTLKEDATVVDGGGTFKLKNVKGGTRWRLKYRKLDLTDLTITFTSDTKFRPKGKTSADLDKDVRVTVKGKITGTGPYTLTATMIIIKPAPKLED